MTSAKYYAFEGINGSGKSFVIEGIKDIFVQQDFIITKEPGSLHCESCIKFRDILDQCKLNPLARTFVYAADRVEHIENIVWPALNEGKSVLCDRSFLSGLAYQTLGSDISIGLLSYLIRELPCNGIYPDKIFLLDVDPEIAMKRIVPTEGEVNKTVGGWSTEDISFQKKLRKAYLRLARYREFNVEIIDAGRDKEDVLTEVISRLKFK